MGVYNSLLSGDAFDGGDTHGITFIPATNILSDDADKGSAPSDQIGIIGELDNFLHTPTNTFVAALWSGYFSGIAKCNQALKALETATVDETTKNRWMGEVRFIRGYYYFNLVRFFGGVPAVLRVPESAEDANKDPKLSDGAINAALQCMGYDTKTEITGHGFRAMARTILHEELGVAPEVIEHQLAHGVPDPLGDAYNRTKFLKARRVMMQRWSDYLDQLRETGRRGTSSPSEADDESLL